MMRQHIDTQWDRLSPLLAEALERGGGLHTLEIVKARIDDGRAQFWPCQRSALVTRIVDQPTGRVLDYWLAAGDLAEIREAEPHIAAWAAEAGCRRAFFTGRRGWLRAMPGWCEVSTLGVKELG
jgi:hypothetical protein